MNRSKQKGTRWESAIVDYLARVGVVHAERRALAGAKDRGDISGIPGVVIEAKSCATLSLGAWLDEAHVERDNDRAAVGVVWFKRRGHPSAGAGYVLMDGATLVGLLSAAGYVALVPPVDNAAPVGRLVADAAARTLAPTGEAAPWEAER